jgi:DNA-binding transcriptional regulator YiaG
METCKSLPDLPFATLAHASEAKLRNWERSQKEAKAKK